MNADNLEAVQPPLMNTAELHQRTRIAPGVVPVRQGLGKVVFLHSQLVHSRLQALLVGEKRIEARLQRREGLFAGVSLEIKFLLEPCDLRLQEADLGAKAAVFAFQTDKCYRVVVMVGG